MLRFCVRIDKKRKGGTKTVFKKFITNPRLLIVISAVLSALPFTFSGMFFVSWVSFVPLFYVMIKQNGNKLRQAFGYGFLFGLIYHI